MGETTSIQLSCLLSSVISSIAYCSLIFLCLPCLFLRWSHWNCLFQGNDEQTHDSLGDWNLLWSQQKSSHVQNALVVFSWSVWIWTSKICPKFGCQYDFLPPLDIRDCSFPYCIINARRSCFHLPWLLVNAKCLPLVPLHWPWRCGYVWSKQKLV